MTPLTKLIDEQVSEFHGGHHEKSNFERAKIENKRCLHGTHKKFLSYHSSIQTYQFIVFQNIFFGQPVEISIEQKHNS